MVAIVTIDDDLSDSSTITASAAVSSKHEELDGLYNSVSKVIGDGLSAFEK